MGGGPVGVRAVGVRAVGVRSVLVELGDQEAVHRLWSAWWARADPDTEEIVAGHGSLLVTVRAGLDPMAVLGRLQSVAPPAAGPGSREVVIPVEYDGVDLADVATLTGLSAAEVVQRHSGASYTVAFLGFSPGFAYLTGGDPALDVPRLDRPRTTVPAGSVATAAGVSAVYPQATPGGWRLLGRTDEVLFDPHRRPPALLAPGDRVHFEPVRPRTTGPASRITAPDNPRPLSADGVAHGPGPAGPPGRYVRVLAPGPLTTVQDGGRVGWAHLGVPRAGAADRASAAAANRLVGNPADAPLLEATLAGPHLRVGAPGLVAVTGGRAPVTVDGLPARQDVALALPAGAELAVGSLSAGMRVYIAFSGGLAVEAVLGSRSTDTLAGLGPPPLQAGDVLPLGPSSSPNAHPGDPAAGPPIGPAGRGTPPGWAGPARRAGPAVFEVQAHVGPRHDRVGPAGLEALTRAEFLVHPSSDRTGVRLTGETVPVGRPGEIRSEPMVPGAIQIPHGGSPIVLLRNHPTTGGYPVAAVVDDAGVDILAQARPGDRVRIRLLRAGPTRPA